MRKLPLAVLVLTALLFANQAAHAQMGTDNNPMAVKGWDSVASAPCPLGGLPFNTNCKLPDGGSSSGGSVTAASGAFVTGAIVDIGTASSPAAGTVNAQLATLNATAASALTAQSGDGVNIGGVQLLAKATGGAGALCTGQIKATATACGSAAAHGVIVYDFGNAANAATSYFQVFDVAVGSVTVGTTPPRYSFEMPAGVGRIVTIPGGDDFVNQVTIACTTTATGNTAPANNCSYNVIGK